MKKIIILILLSMFCLTAFAEDDVFDINLYKLPKEAINEQHIEIRDSIAYYQGDLFTGVSYSVFEDNQLEQVFSYLKGKLNGPSYAWYEDGTNAMQANYVNGYLNGRFIAWSSYGSIIYDIFFDKNQFRFDLQLNRDLTREDESEDDSDSEGDNKESGGE